LIKLNAKKSSRGSTHQQRYDRASRARRRVQGVSKPFAVVPKGV
jgi:hypothetical protein